MAFAGVVLGVVLMIALPASAKGFSSASFTGPGLPPGGIKIHGGGGGGDGEHPGPVDSVLFQTGVFNAERTAGPWTFGLDRTTLGPPYRMVVAPDWDPSSYVTVVLYPYAKGGAWSYTPPNQSIGPGTETVTGGWWQIGHRMIGSYSASIARHFRSFLVHRVGFPSTPPAYAPPSKPLPGQPVKQAATEPEPATASGSSASSTWPGWAWGLIAVGMGLTLILVAVRQRHRTAVI